MPINILEIPQNADSLGRTLDNLGKDFRTSASRTFGIGDSAVVYGIRIENFAKELSAGIA